MKVTIEVVSPDIVAVALANEVTRIMQGINAEISKNPLHFVDYGSTVSIRTTKAVGEAVVAALRKAGWYVNGYDFHGSQRSAGYIRISSTKPVERD